VNERAFTVRLAVRPGVGCCRLVSLEQALTPHSSADWRLKSAPVASRQVLAMQKVEGSSHFIRFSETRKQTASAFWLFRKWSRRLGWPRGRGEHPRRR
jgi:hypothetical protein